MLEVDILEVAAFKRALAETNTVCIDCRFTLGQPQQGGEDYAQGHIPTAYFADLDQQLSAAISADSGRHPLPSADSFGETIASFGGRLDSHFLIYDHGDFMIAARLWWLLSYFGFKRVSLLRGGYRAWSQCEEVVAQSAKLHEARALVLKPHTDMTVSLGQVEAQIPSKAFQLIDARAGERFRGEVEPLENVAGHIPGALSFPFMGNLDKDGHMKSPSELRERFSALVAESGDKGLQTVCYCGSGVTACHNLLAIHLACLPQPKLFVGSWSQWVKDPKRGVEIGA